MRRDEYELTSDVFRTRTQESAGCAERMRVC